METMEKLFGENPPSNSVVTPESAPEAPVQQPEAAPPPADEVLPEAIYGTAEAAPEQPEPKPAEPGFVPLKAMLDERDRYRDAKAERDRLKDQLDNLKRERETVKPPDPIADPEAYDAHVQRALWQQNVRFSERLAVKEYGADAVKAAKDWWVDLEKQNPAFAQIVSRQEDPIEYVVKEHRRHQALAEIGDKSIDDFVRDRAAKLGLTVAPAAAASAPQPAPVTMQRPAVAAPPRSIAAETSAAGPRTVVEPSAVHRKLFGSQA